MSHKDRTELSVRSEKAILVGVILPGSSADPRDPLGELASLTKTAGAQVVAQVIQHRKHIDPSTFIGKGKAEEIHKLAHKLDADVVIFDHDMSPNQLRDLEEIINRKILDRSELILDIFATRARTHEAQLQVGLAQLEYTYPRLRHMWSHLERMAGGAGAGAGAGVGARGPGEMQLEIDRRIVRDRVSDFKARIADVQARKSREVQKRKRQHFTISIVGYTNAGKSTLFNTLTGADTFVEDKLFATLDTKTRRWHLGGDEAPSTPPEPIKNQKSKIKNSPDESNSDAISINGIAGRGGGAHAALISDTVGFVRDLPHHLVASFKATLEEATHADMLLLVLDVSHPHAQQQLKTVVQVLIDIGCEHIPTLLVLNKIDALENHEEDSRTANADPHADARASKDDLAFWKSLFPDALPASALLGDGIMQLAETVREQMLGQVLRCVISVPLADAKGTTFIEKFSNVQERDYDSTPNHVLLTTDISQRILDQLPNNVPSAKILKTKASPSTKSSPWRCRTKPIKELIPEGFLESAAPPSDASEAHSDYNAPPAHKKRRPRGGLTIGKTKLTAP